jgi:hypothetical protein
MKNAFRLSTLLALILLSFSACNRLPEHAKHIPADAVAVVGLNTGKIGKQIAWSALMGSKLFQELQTKIPHQAAMEGLGDAGIRHTSTSYLYATKTIHRGTQITALVPLNDAGKWEAYVKKNFPQAAIKTVSGRKEAQLASGMYAGWNDDLLIVMNIVDDSQITTRITADTVINTADTSQGSAITLSTDSMQPTQSAPTPVDTALLASGMARAFQVPERNLTSDSRFKKMETDGHDITVWVNYHVLMQQNGDKLGMPAELALGNTLWKDAAFSGGFDFELGKITGDMRYYLSEELRSVAKEFGSRSTDQELLDRLPGNNLNMLMSLHLSSKGIKALLEKTGVLGFANLALSSEGLSTDDVFEAFTGDMGAAVNGFQMNYVNQWTASPDSPMVRYDSHTTHMDFVYAMKIGNAEKFKKIVSYLQQKTLLQPLGDNLFLSSSTDSMFMAYDGRYMVVANKPQLAKSYLAGTFKNKTTTSMVREKVYGHPMGMYINFQSILGSIQNQASRQPTDSVALAESRKLLDNLVFSGGDYQQNAFSYQFALHFINKKENAVFQLMNFALKMNEAAQQQPAQQQYPTQASLGVGKSATGL